tara:strand:- start:1831 stop:2235 length:405 start_codon:yes stop_codon:yes gene_type:complete
MIKLKDILLESMTKVDIQTIIDRVYPKIVKNLGKAKQGTPTVEIHDNIYVRVSGLEGAQGEANPYAEYDRKENKIYLYTKRLINLEQIIRSLLHEYTHTLQDPTKIAINRGYGYENNPYEKAAHKAEENWRKYI